MSTQDQPDEGVAGPSSFARRLTGLRAVISLQLLRRSAVPCADTGSAAPVLRQAKWHHIYFVLAAFDLLTVMGSLHLSHQIMFIYAASVDTNQEWADRLARYSELAQLAAAVDAPGNDVFDTRAMDTEAARQEQAVTLFDQELEAARADLTTAGPEPEARRLLASLDVVAEAMRSMVAEANLIFAYFRQGEAERAGERMATMDRKYARVS